MSGVKGSECVSTRVCACGSVWGHGECMCLGVSLCDCERVCVIVSLECDFVYGLCTSGGVCE